MKRGVKKAQQVFLGLLLTCLMLALFALPVTVQAEDTADVVSNMAELQAWLDANPAGGTVTLAENIEITEPVRLYLCRVEAQGELSLPDLVTLDTCIVSPNISGGTVISRKITEVKPSFPFLIDIDEGATGFFDNLNVRCFLTLAAEGVEDEYELAYIRFDDSAIDFDTSGEYLLPGTLQPPYDDLYAFDIVAQDKPLAADLTIYDPAIPFFYGSYRNPMMFAVDYYYTGELGELTLWRSDDDGDSWHIYWQPSEEESDSFLIDYNGYNLILLFFDPAELSAPTLFVFEVGEGVGSGILYIDTATVKSVGQGGDRDSGDRILLPWEFFTGNPGEDGNTNPPPNTGDETGGTNPAPNTGGDTGGTNPPPNTGDETGNTNPPPNTEDETGSTNPPVQDNTANDDSGGDNRRANYSTPAVQPATGLAVMAPLAFSEAVAPIAESTETPPDALPAQETALPDTSGEIIASSVTAATTEQPIPDMSGEANPPPGEYEDETTIAISGKRLTALMSVNPQMVPFAREDIQVWIPTGLLSGMSLADSDIFTVTIEKTTQTRVSVLFNMNGQALDKPFAEPFLVGIPWSETNGEIICTDSGGKEIPCEYDRQNSLLILTLYECGTYTIETKPDENGIVGNVNSADTHISGNPTEIMPELVSEQPPATSPLVPLLAAGTVGVGGAGGLVYAFRKRRVKGN